AQVQARAGPILFSSVKSVASCCSVQAAAFEEGLDVGGVAGEVLEQFQRVLAAALRQQGGAEVVAVGAAQAAVVLEPLHRVRVQHLGPDVGVVAGRVA